MPLFQMQRNNNVIEFAGKFGMTEIRAFLATAFKITNKLGYQDLVLDFSNTTAAFPGFMICVCSRALALRDNNVDIRLILPHKDSLRRLFVNTNWASLISPREYPVSTFRGYTHVPTVLFKDDSDQHRAVNQVLDAILSSIDDISRKDLSAVEWAINEISDNVLVHAESGVGGLLQLSSFNTKQKRIEYVVCDAGIGIPASLKPALGLTSDVQCLDMAIKEGVTNGKGAGNGLFGSFQTSSKSGGYFHLESGNASLNYNPNPHQGLSIRNERVPFQGTLLVSCLDYSVPKLLAKALKFDGKIYDATDYTEIHYEDFSEDILKFQLAIESHSFGSRPAGKPVRTKLLNLLNYYTSSFVIRVDFTDSPMISSSFADEVFGKLFQTIGENEYNSRIKLHKCDSMNKLLIDRSIYQRKTKMESND